MAKSKTTKLDDTERCINFRMGSTAQEGAIQIPLALSLANRRLYKQLRCYRAKITLSQWTPSDSTHVYKFYTLSNAWWVKQAIKLARQTWLDHTVEERKAARRSGAKYFDFVIDTFKSGGDADFMQFNHDMAVEEFVMDENLFGAQKYYLTRREGATGDSETFGDIDTIGFTVDETNASGTQTRYNIFDEYIKNLNIDPETDTRVGAYADLEGSDQIAQTALEQLGDEPPWDADSLPTPWVLRSVLASGGGIAHSNTGFMDCPLGVIMVQKLDGSNAGVNFDDEDEFCLHLAKGKYRGIHAPAY